MAIWGRTDGTRVRKLSVLRRFMPFIMPTRNESIVYFEQTFEVSDTLRYLAVANPDGEKRVSFFHVVLAAVVRVLAQRPGMHRFIVGRRVYQRNDIELSFAVKKRFEDDSPLSTVKVKFEPSDTLAEVPGRVDRAIDEGRSTEKTHSEKEMSVIGALPRFLVRFVMWCQRVLDYFGILPSGMIRPDPLYASVFLANLGSIGLDAPFHHLYEYGTIPVFVAIGRIRRAPVVLDDNTVGVGDVVTIRYAFDERIADGYYCAKSLELLQEYVQNPSRLG